MLANHFVLNVIESGYLIPFFLEPTPKTLKNNKSAFEHSEFVVTSIENLVSIGVVKECTDHIPHVVNPLSVSVNANGKARLILDLRHVNQFVEKRKFKFESVPEAIQYINNKGFLFKFDLKSGYHHISIHSPHKKFLGFSWTFEGKVRYYAFSCLPFGLSVAGHVFSKVLRPLVKYWRSKGFRMIVYLDDGWGFAESFEFCKFVSNSVKRFDISWIFLLILRRVFGNLREGLHG